MKKFVLWLAVLIFVYDGMTAQEMTGAGKDLFQYNYNTFSKKKPVVVILKDGKQVEGNITKLRRKGLFIQSVFIKDKKTGKVLELPASKIDEMYAYPHGFDKAMKAYKHATSLYQIQRKSSKNGLLAKGAVLLRGLKFSRKNKKAPQYYLLQLVNPGFDRYLEVYGDPAGVETASLNVGMMTVAGGIKKSYYVRKGDKIYYVRKKDFKKIYDTLFGDCKEFMKKYPAKKAKWRYFSQYVYEYTLMRSKKEKGKTEGEENKQDK